MDNECKVILDDFTMLLNKSEERIDRTNEMVSKCILTINKVTEEYVKQLDKLQEARDKLIEQNGELIKNNEKLISELSDSRKRNVILLEKLVNLAYTSKSENNINVK